MIIEFKCLKNNLRPFDKKKKKWIKNWKKNVTNPKKSKKIQKLLKTTQKVLKFRLSFKTNYVQLFETIFNNK